MTSLLKNDASLVSVGIDIGTTSTHMALSRLSLANQSQGTQVPRVAVVEREIIYLSPVVFTPLTGDGVIDAEAVGRLLINEYRNAGVQSGEVDCGAAIITGESAARRNAPQVISRVAQMAGDFIAASAGPHLEGLYAAHGSGAFGYSEENQKTVVNVDLGGGTTNIAVIESGRLVASWCLNIGGRALVVDKDGRITSRSAAARALLRRLDLLAIEHLDEQPARSIAGAAAEVIAESLMGRDIDPAFMVTEPEQPGSVDEIWFSGGVAQMMLDIDGDPWRFNDLGGYLAGCLIDELVSREISYRVSDSAIRATVIGAGGHSIQLSGHTIDADCQLLPLKNLPIIRPFQNLDDSEICPERLDRELTKALARVDMAGECPDKKGERIAVFLPVLGIKSYDSLIDWCDSLIASFRANQLANPYIVILSEDMAMALGQQMRRRLEGGEVIVLDGVDCSRGDFLEIGKPVAGGLTLPVTVKTLLFSA